MLQVTNTNPFIDVAVFKIVSALQRGWVHAVLSSFLYVFLSWQCNAAPGAYDLHESTALTYTKQLISQHMMASFVDNTQKVMAFSDHNGSLLSHRAPVLTVENLDSGQPGMILRFSLN